MKHVVVAVVQVHILLQAGCVAVPPPGGSFSVSIDSKGFHSSCSSGKGSTSSNPGHPTASSGQDCPKYACFVLVLYCIV